MQGQVMGKLQQLLQKQQARDVSLILISLDPQTDTPARLKEWAGRFSVKPPWTLVSGSKAEMERAVKTLTGRDLGKGEHYPVLCLGSDRTGDWLQVPAVTAPDTLAQRLEKLNSPALPVALPTHER